MLSKKTRQIKHTESLFNLPQLPSLLTQPLGLEGWTAYEPVLLAALISGDPLLLIGPHGSAKSFLLERLAQALDMEFRFYNASLINYDDLVGIPIPAEDRKSLEYISHPSAIWDAQVVFFDEISRTRPELQNKLFPIIHERRVQGIKLKRLQYRWAAMNPPPSAEGPEESLDIYLGAEPIDPALADRFCFILEVPGWQQLTEQEKRRIFRDHYSGSREFPIPLAELVGYGRKFLLSLEQSPSHSLEDYLLALLGQLESGGLIFSTRRVTMLHKNILAVHAARMALYQAAFPEEKAELADWKTSVLLALQNSIPQIALGYKPDPALIIGAHRHAWELSRLDDDNPWRKLLQIADPSERCIIAIGMGDKIRDETLSELILDAMRSQSDAHLRKAMMLPLYVFLHHTRNLSATVFETIAQELRDFLRPVSMNHNPGICARGRYRDVQKLCEEITTNTTPATKLRDRYGCNLLQGLVSCGYETETPRQTWKAFCTTWNRLVKSTDPTISEKAL